MGVQGLRLITNLEKNLKFSFMVCIIGLLTLKPWMIRFNDLHLGTNSNEEYNLDDGFYHSQQCVDKILLL